MHQLTVEIQSTFLASYSTFRHGLSSGRNSAVSRFVAEDHSNQKFRQRYRNTGTGRLYANVCGV